MKSITRAAKVAVGAFLCLLALTPAARAVENVSPPAMTDEKLAQPAIVSALEKATNGLLMPSETDAPFQVVFVELADENGASPQKMKAQQIAKLVGAPENAEIETRELDEFFEAAATLEDWMNEEEKATAQRFAALLETLKTQLQDAQVLVWGDAEKQVVIIGQVEGGLAGVTTLVVET